MTPRVTLKPGCELTGLSAAADTRADGVPIQMGSTMADCIKVDGKVSVEGATYSSGVQADNLTTRAQLDTTTTPVMRLR